MRNQSYIYRLTAAVLAVAAIVLGGGSAAAQQTADSLTVQSVAPVAKAAETSGSGKDAPMVLKKRFLPTARRIDRNVNKSKYVFKGETLLGFTASYGTFTSEDADMFPVFENIDITGRVATVNPFVGFFYRDNQCIGLRLGYTHLKGGIENLGINLGSLNDLDLSIPGINLASDRYSVGLFHRSYVALDDKGRFGVFGEFEAMFSWGDNVFSYTTGDRERKTLSQNMNLKLMFSPGLAVYAFPNVCATLSFGLGGFKYNNVRQFDEEGNKTGERNFSKLNFRLNLADIRLGVNFHLWNKKKSSNRKL